MAEYLVYFAPKATEAGTMPEHYYLCNCRAELTEAIAAGGKHTDSCEDWQCYEAQFEREQACYL